MDEIDRLQVYELSIPKDGKAFLNRISEIVWKEDAKEAVLKEETDSESGTVDYFIQLKKDKVKKSISGTSEEYNICDSSLIWEKNNLTEEELAEQYRELLRAGAWESETPQSEIRKWSSAEYVITNKFGQNEMGVWDYGKGWDGVVYGIIPKMKFCFRADYSLKDMYHLSSYEVMGKRRLGESYSSESDIMNSIEKVVQTVSERLKNSDYENFHYDRVSVHYCLGREKAQKENQVMAFPVLELEGMVTYKNTKKEVECCAGLNLDTGEVIGLSQYKAEL